MTMSADSNPSPTPAATAAAPGRLSILAIEDNDDMREFLQRILERRGFRFLGAGDGVDGLELAMRERPDLILMDLALPTLDGYEATRLLKTKPEFASIPIVAVTAHARAVDQERALEAGCDAYISKPYSIHELFALIDRLLPPAP
jgi:CheY-like chemotaxis protein